MDSPPIPFPSSMSKTRAKLLLVPCLCIILKSPYETSSKKSLVMEF